MSGLNLKSIQNVAFIAGMLWLALPTDFALADRVALKSGMVYHDVKAEPTGNAHRISFSNGMIKFIPNSQIRSVRPGPLTWQFPYRPPVQKPLPVADKKAENTPVDTPEKPTRKRPDELRKPTEATAEQNWHPGKDWGPVLKSAILPGWGQYSIGEKRNGALFAASSLIVFYRYWALRQQHAAAEADYNDPVPVAAIAAQSQTGAFSVLDVTAMNLFYLSEKERRVYRLQNEGNAMLGLFTFLWGWNMLDISCRGPLMERCRRLFSRTGEQSRLPDFVPGFYWYRDTVSASVTFFL